jgi:hypothetical protein
MKKRKIAGAHRMRLEYKIDNKGIIKEKAKEYKIGNKDSIAIKKRAYIDSIVEREKAIVVCECGSSCSRQSLSSHIKTALITPSPKIYSVYNIYIYTL